MSGESPSAEDILRASRLAAGNQPAPRGGRGCLVQLAIGLVLAALFTGCGAGAALTVERIWFH